MGAAFAGRDLLAGIIELIQFFTTVDDAKSEEDLKACGKLFGDAVAKIGVDGLFFALSMFGLKKASARLTTRTVVNNGLNSRKWKGKIIKERKLRLGNRETTHSMDSSAPSKTPHARTTTLNKPVKVYKTQAQITEYIKTLKVDSAQQTKLMTELAHDPKNLKRFLNRYGEEAESLIKRNGYPPKYWKSRPHHREMQIKEVWENAKKDQKNFYFSKNNTEYIRTEMVRYHGTKIYLVTGNGIWGI